LSRDRARAVVAVASLSLIAVLQPGLASPAKAQVAVSASATTDYRYRGVAVGDARPAVSLDLSYDDSGGAYAGGSLIAGDAPGVGPRVLGALASLGYARRAAGGFTLDAGLSHASFFSYGYGAATSESTEAYAGLIRGPIRAYVYYSPHYFAPGVKTLYFSLDATARPARRLRLFGHVGVLDPLSVSAGGDRQASYDARAGVAADFRGGEVQLAWITRGPDAAGPPGTPPRRAALVLGASWFF
jgi:uncharacterized protein (TIGR02001 family)